jgi:mitotic spindle assembly checkpoint protein MAD1
VPSARDGTSLFSILCFRVVNLDACVFRTRNAVPDTPASTPVSITQSLSTLRLEHAHLLEEHGADRAALRQREAELAEAREREVDARATADTLLQASRAAEDRATRAERTAALAEREVRFLQALNVCYVPPPPPVLLPPLFIDMVRIG